MKKLFLFSLMLSTLASSYAATTTRTASMARTEADSLILQLESEIAGFQTNGVFKDKYHEGNRMGCEVSIKLQSENNVCVEISKTSPNLGPKAGGHACDLRPTSKEHVYKGEFVDHDEHPDTVRFVKYDELLFVEVLSKYNNELVTCIVELQ